MSLSKCYTSTPETTNTARLARLILGPCTDVLRDILKTEVKPSDLSRKVKEFTDKLPRGHRNPLNKTQSEIIFPKPTKQYSGDYSDLDISLLYLLLRNVSKIASHSKGWGEIPSPGERSVAANIERIRLIRNQYYGHSTGLSLSESDFRQEWRNIRDIVVELERHLGTTTVYQDAVNTIKTCSMDPAQEKKYIDLLGDIREVHTTVDNLSKTTKQMIQKHYESVSHLFVKTCAFDKAREMLDKNGYVVIKGNPGTGKTTIAKMLMKGLIEDGKFPLQLYKFKDLYGSISAGDAKYPFLVNIKNSQGAKALQSAASSGDKHAFNLVLKFGFNPYEKDRDNGHTVLTCACQDGRTNMVKYLIKKYPALLKEHTDVHGKSLLYWAAYSGKVDMFEYIFNLFENENILHISSDIKCNLDTKDNSGESMLHAACIAGHYDMCEYLLSRNLQMLEVCYKDGENVLHSAAQGGNINLFKFLLSKGFNLNCTTNTGETVLHKCCANGREEMCRYLVNKHQSLISVRDNYGWTALHSACRGGSVEIVIFLTNKGLDVNDLSNDGQSVLHIACLYGRYEIVEYLVKSHPHLLDVRDTLSNSVLHDAAWGGHIEIVKLLIEKKMDVYTLHEGCESILHLCCRSGKKEMCEYLVNHFTDLLNIKGNNGWTVLHSACFGGSVDIVSFLIQKGLDLNDLSNDGQSVLHIASLNGKLEICEHLVKNHPHLLDVKDKHSQSVLHYAALGGNVQILNLLIGKNMDMNTLQGYCGTILHQCCRSGKMEMCEYLVNHFPDSLEIRDNNGWTMLHSACSGGSVIVLSFFINKGLDINSLSNDGESILQIACLNGNFEICKHLVDNYPNLLNVRDKSSNSALHDAARGGNVQIVKLLIEKNMDITSLQENGKTVLHQCCRSGEMEMCEYLVNQFSDLLETRDTNGFTALHAACIGGSVDVLYLLIEKGFEINALSNKGKNILHIACLNGKHRICNFLVENHPHLLNGKDKYRNTVLHDAARGGNVQIVNLLIEKKVDIKSLQKDGETILHQSCRSGEMDMCEYLVSQFSDILEIRDTNGFTALHSACRGGRVKFLSFLINKGLEINALSNDGKSILHIACFFGKVEVVEHLIENYPHLLEARDKSSNSVLHAASCGGNVQIVKLLIKKNMDINTVQKDGETILHQCCRSGKMEMCEYLVNKFSDLLEIKDNNGWTVLHSACRGGSLKIVTFLINRGLDFNALSSDGKGILHRACFSGKFQICDYLVKNHPNLLEVRDKFNNSALHDAARGGNVRIVKLLIEKKMDIRSLKKDGTTVLHQCCRFGKMKMCEYLINNFPDLLEIRDNKGWTVLHSACRGGSVKIVSFLIKKGLNLNALSNEGESILHIACLSCKHNVCRYLAAKHPLILEVKDNHGKSVFDIAIEHGDKDMIHLLSELYGNKPLL
ncbi:serine/threonine-protein phosphatase 6 regulatory ankyrin repeat subunit B-like [Saccostrea cucullata]|uniref:serine/threonine-protein phosphatase 6 regulatory ankyrin repeat subunit B-like n=1 Tax=Saccostrea cuccullata TaxID=36930 RepID=UPI002ED08908